MELTGGEKRIRSFDGIDVRLAIENVTPQEGSLKGGTLVTISGFAFSSSSAVVFIEVPVSTTHPDGLVNCDVYMRSETELRCMTRSYCSADASPEDPMARKCTYKETVEPSLVTDPTAQVSSVTIWDSSTPPHQILGAACVGIV